LLRIPPDHKFPHEPEDEFKCTNLDVTLPSLDSIDDSKKWPVFVWIHGIVLVASWWLKALIIGVGGSQAVTFGSAASGICGMYGLIYLS
jgi:hypothetical protein